MIDRCQSGWWNGSTQNIDRANGHFYWWHYFGWRWRSLIGCSIGSWNHSLSNHKWHSALLLVTSRVGQQTQCPKGQRQTERSCQIHLPVSIMPFCAVGLGPSETCALPNLFTTRAPASSSQPSSFFYWSIFLHPFVQPAVHSGRGDGEIITHFKTHIFHVL